MRLRSTRRFAFPAAAGRLRGAFSVALALLLLPFALHADIQAPPRATAVGERRLQRREDGPPTAVGQDTAVAQGGQVEVVLRAEGQIGRMIYFLIRTPPRHGTIVGPPSQISRSSATIGYLHNEGDQSTDDEFTFCAQAVGSAVSAPETVRIRILPAPPLLEVSPPELDFGAVKAGETARAEFTLENRGGSEARGRVDPPSPWVVEGSPDYRLPRGASQTFQLVFRPRDEQTFTDELHFQYEARNGGVRLVGTGLLDAAQKAALAAAETARNDARVAAAASARAGGPGVGAGPAGGRSGLASGPGASAAAAARPAAPAAPVVAAGGASSARQAPTPPAALPAAPRNDGLDLVYGVHSLANADTTSVPLNEASVDRVDVLGVKGSTVDLSWRPPTPRPAGYRVELRYLSIDDDKLRIDWRPYALTDLNVTPNLVTAHLRNLPQEGFQMMRIVSVDKAGRLAAPSPMITVLMPWPSSWWQVTPLKLLVVALLVCVVLVVRRRLENDAILREIDEDRRESRRASEVGSRVAGKR